MIKKISLIFCLFLVVSCNELQQVVNQLPGSTSNGLSNEAIANGLKEALEQGIEKQVSKLTKTDGFYKNDLVKILMPEELQKVDKTLRDIGLGNLYNKFNPIINESFKKVGADEIWSTIISKYNSIPLTNNVNPDLTDYVTEEALSGVYKMIAVEEEEIRTKISSRTTDVLKKVFALQDKK